MSAVEQRRWRTWEDFIQPGTDGVLANRLGITDVAELARIERIVTLRRSVELTARPIPGRFDLEHLRAIHRYLFGDLYEWAGVIRPFDITKGDTMFCLAVHIESYAADIFDRLRRMDLLRGLGRDEFVDRATELLADLNALHPFREGSGRTQRAFLAQLADKAGHPLAWPDKAHDRNIAASIDAMRGDNTALRALVAQAAGAQTP